MRDRASRRPMPVEQSILWKPLRDSHYVVASLQPADGGRRTIFVRQQLLGRIEGLARAHGRRTYGILLGHVYGCPATGTDYLVIESIAEQNPISDETAMAASVSSALANLADHKADVLGWYRGVPTVEARPSASTASVHGSMFAQPWQTLLVVGEAARGSGGAFFLHDAVNWRWFYAPFYELLDHAPTPHQAKGTVMTWPQYMTADNVASASPEPTAALAVTKREPRKPDDRPEPLYLRPTETVVDQETFMDVPVLKPPPEPPAPTRDSIAPETPVARSLWDRHVTQPASSGVADVPHRERPLTRRADRWIEKLPSVDDHDQRIEAPRNGARVGDTDDTTADDDPGRYIEIARLDGFFVAAKLEAGSKSHQETLWILNEPYSGMLLVVATTDTEVVDATLHYNLRTDDAGLRKIPFPEHRDPESKTIYVRETCVDGLRARCRRLRATNALLREWKVSPAISFLTPAEWESIPADVRIDSDADPVGTLNKARIAELPDGVRSQFHIGGANAGA